MKRALKIIKHVRPHIWTLENPVGLLKGQQFMRKYNKYKHTTCYCKWGKPYKKPTNIWTNVKGLDLPMCNANTPCAHKAKYGRRRAALSSRFRSARRQRHGGYRLGNRVTQFLPQRASYIHTNHTRRHQVGKLWRRPGKSSGGEGLRPPPKECSKHRTLTKVRSADGATHSPPGQQGAPDWLRGVSSCL